jgi:K+-transporting ATPase ATPase A chain
MLGLTVQNFASAAVGIAVLFALIRGFFKVKERAIGNFWTDITRVIIYILLPLSIIVAIFIGSQGVVQNFSSYEEVELLQPITLEDGTIITKEIVPQGPAASQIAIKQIGTNGGGFFGVNSAHPFENPNIITNIVEMLSILLIPAALCFTFGRNVKDKKQGVAIFMAMFILLVAALAIIAVNEANATPQLIQGGAVDVSAIGQAGGNMEGKESRLGIVASSTWAALTTAASNGSVNAMHDSFTPLGGMATMLLMELGEVVFGGVGCGLYGMLAFAIITVFIAGLMVGRTPEYLGKKIEPFEMKMAMLICLATPIATLIGSGLASIVPSITDSLNNSGSHGFSELLYAFSSAGGNNGSAFAGFRADTVFINVSLGLIMLFVRFVPMIATLAIAGSLAKKKRVAVSAGTLPTDNALFIGLLVGIVILVGALSFFPALAIGPIAEFFQMLG